jgi:hypothetical protein
MEILRKMENNDQENPTFEFDKFMENISRHEQARQVQETEEQTLQRQRQQRYQELPQNRVRYR